MQCRYFDICGGNTRVRAHQLTGDPWAEDPACYLTDAEIGVEDPGERLRNRPYTRQNSDLCGGVACPGETPRRAKTTI